MSFRSVLMDLENKVFKYSSMIGAYLRGVTLKDITITSITTAGTGVLTAAGIVGGIIMRSGAGAGYADATDTAANIIALLPNGPGNVAVPVGASFEFTVVNTVAFADTITAGVGVTFAGTTAIAASTWRRFVCNVTSATTVTITGIASGTL